MNKPVLTELERILTGLDNRLDRLERTVEAIEERFTKIQPKKKPIRTYTQNPDQEEGERPERP